MPFHLRERGAWNREIQGKQRIRSIERVQLKYLANTTIRVFLYYEENQEGKDNETW